MTFIHASASHGARNQKVLSADNPIPERHIVIETLRQAAPLLGLKPPVLATLDALISCLPPKRAHHTVFASNATLVFRRNGISDRTIRRHIATLQDCGLLERRDSPNRKRYTRHNYEDGTALRFGFDLSPLFNRLSEMTALAAEALRTQERCKYLKAKIRAAAHEIIAITPDCLHASAAFKALRRKLDVQDCEDILATLNHAEVKAEQSCEQNTIEPEQTSINDGQNVRHYQNSNKELKDKKESETQQHSKQSSTGISLAQLIDACPTATEFAIEPIVSIEDAVSHAKTLAPMIGIDNYNYEAAQQHLGPVGTAVTIWGIMQIHTRIRQVGAYFRSITSGKNKEKFNPYAFIKRLSADRDSSMTALA